MNRIIFYMIFLVILLGCRSKNQELSSHVGYSKDERRYNLECIDKTLNDTLVSIAIDLETNSARIKFSRRVRLGFSLILNEGAIRVYNIEFYKLKSPLGYNSSVQLDSSNVFFPIKMKKNIKEDLVNTSVQFVETKKGIVFTNELTGAEALRKTLVVFHSMAELKGHRLIITESFQDALRNEMLTIVQDN